MRSRKTWYRLQKVHFSRLLEQLGSCFWRGWVLCIYVVVYIHHFEYVSVYTIFMCVHIVYIHDTYKFFNMYACIWCFYVYTHTYICVYVCDGLGWLYVYIQIMIWKVLVFDAGRFFNDNYTCTIYDIDVRVYTWYFHICVYTHTAFVYIMFACIHVNTYMLFWL